MKLDAVFHGSPREAADAALHMERQGIDGMWSLDTAHNPFFPLLLAAEHTSRLEVGSGIAVALARSPMTLAQEAWDLAALSGGRFLLGLGSQVEPHIVRRFAMRWDNPVEQMRDMIGALRAIWDSFQNGTRLRYEGPYFKLTLLTQFFNPGPIEHPHIPILLAGVGPKMTQLAGEVADGYVLHPFSHPSYFEQITVPALERGMRKSGRERTAFTMVAPIFIITGNASQQAALERKVREQIAFYGSTPAYQEVLAVLGRADLATELHRLSKASEWEAMVRLITDDLVEAFAVRADLSELPDALLARWGGKVDRIVTHFELPDDEVDNVRLCIQALAARSVPGSII